MDKYLLIARIVVFIILFFAPLNTCNGKTYYTGIRGCSTNNKNDNKNIVNMFKNLVKF